MKTRSTLVPRAALPLLAGLAFTAAAHAAPTATTQNGKVTGITAEGMDEFLGIRYAAPPVGDMRWQPPQPVPAAIATHKATAFGPHCAQPASPYGVASNTEDCLYLNVYTPGGTRPVNAKKLPVMLWIHGGALVVGESDSYDPVRLVTKGDVIVVTINYRLGYFGFLATSGLDAEGHLAGNYGLLDQQFAMDWVRRNIAGFGGDPTQVTIFGESAGGLSVLSNLVSPTAYGLFNQAIVESGAYALDLPTLAQSESTGAAVASGVGCAPGDPACLRAASTTAVLQTEANAGLSVTTIVDGTTLPASINAALKAGHFNRVPVLNGSNHDEERLFTVPYANITAAQYDATIPALYGSGLGAEILKAYPASAYSQPVLALAAVLTDQTFACTARQVDRWVSRYVPTYAYEFNDENAPEDSLPPAGYPFGAAHATEIQFLFITPVLPGTPNLSAKERVLSSDMVQYWTNFAKHTSPDSGRVPEWQPYAGGSDIFQSLLPPNPAPETGFAADHHCALWAALINPAEGGGTPVSRYTSSREAGN